jgi:hypothetical protein
MPHRDSMPRAVCQHSRVALSLRTCCADGVQVKAPWDTLIVVCSSCRGARHGPDPSDVRKAIKKELGKPKTLRVVEVECLKLCPDDAVAICTADSAKQHVETRLIGSERDLNEWIAELLSQGHSS